MHPIIQSGTLVASLGLAASPPADRPCTSSEPIAFVNATILTMDAPSLVAGGTVVVREGRIASMSNASIPPDACRIDLGGRVLMPGLADMHVHTSEPELPLYLANGITLIREMNGSPEHLRLRERLARGEAVGPRMLVASPLLVGTPLRYRHTLIQSATDAYRVAHEAKEAGYDYLKIYDGLSGESYAAFAQASTTLGIPMDGHIPAGVGLERILEAGQGIQHMDKIAMALGSHPGGPAELARAARLFAGRRAWVTPTLASLRAMSGAGTSGYTARLESAEMAWADPGLLGWWRSLAGDRAPGPSPFYDFQVALLAVLRDSGARFLVGTDASNPLMVPGFSLHEELAILVRDGGFSRFEALLAATRNVGEFVGDPLRGRVVQGAPADLIVVESSPLDDLAVLRRPVGVMVNGRWFDRAELDSMLAAARRR